MLLGYLSWGALLVGAFRGILPGRRRRVVALAVGSAGRKTSLPFGPFMVARALAALWITDPVLNLMLPRDADQAAGSRSGAAWADQPEADGCHHGLLPPVAGTELLVQAGDIGLRGREADVHESRERRD